MDKIMEKINKLSLPTVILIASVILGGFYYVTQIIKQESIERQQESKIQENRRIEGIRAEKERIENEAILEQEKQEKEEAERALDTCIAVAEESHSNWWDRECESLGKLTSRCVLINKMTFYEYAKKNNISTVTKEFQTAALDFEKEKEECSCSLPFANADRINESLDKAKAECFKKFSQK